VIRVILDQGLPRGAARLLREEGQDAVHVGDLGLAAAPDEVILERAGTEDRAVGHAGFGLRNLRGDFGC